MSATQRRTLGLGLGLLALSVLHWAPARAQQYTVTDMGTFVGTAINSVGQVAGYSANSEAFTWSSGTLTDLGPGIAYAINSAGQVAGSNAQETQAILWANGTATPLSTSTGQSSIAFGINDSGMIVGTAGIPSAPSGFTSTIATVWSGSSVSTLVTPQTQNSTALAINQGGVAVGYLSSTLPTGQLNQAVMWQGGTMKSLGCPPGTPCAGDATAVNNAGQVVGFNEGSFPAGQALLWDQNGTVTDLGAGIARGINDSGQVVGNSTFAWLYINGSLKDLNSLISPSDPLPTNVSLYLAMAINNNGLIVAEGTNGDAYLLTPSVVAAPLPPSAWLLVSGLGGLAAAWRRRGRAA